MISRLDGVHTRRGAPFIKDPDAAEDAVTELLLRAQEADLLRPGVDPRLEAAGLLAMSAGLGTGILVGQRSAESAVAVLDHTLDRIFRDGGRGLLARPTGE